MFIYHVYVNWLIIISLLV